LGGAGRSGRMNSLPKRCCPPHVMTGLAAASIAGKERSLMLAFMLAPFLTGWLVERSGVARSACGGVMLAAVVMSAATHALLVEESPGAVGLQMNGHD
jgi:hypothetical protein